MIRLAGVGGAGRPWIGSHVHIDWILTEGACYAVESEEGLEWLYPESWGSSRSSRYVDCGGWRARRAFVARLYSLAGPVREGGAQVIRLARLQEN